MFSRHTAIAAMILLLLAGCGKTEPPATPVPSTATAVPSVDTPKSSNLFIEAPWGSPATLDGILSPGEWDGARVEELAGGGDLLLMHNDGYVYLGIRSGALGYGSICVAQGDQISILHSSAALGTAVFEKDENGWKRTRQFAWCCRSLADSSQREEHLRREGWSASIGYLGTPEEMEYQIAAPDGALTLAVVYQEGQDTSSAHWWPENLDDDCLGLVLFPDGPPERLEFSPEEWMTVIASTATVGSPLAALGDTRVRDADGMTMIYVPGGTFRMGSTDAQVEDEASQCEQNPVNRVYCERKFYVYEAPQHPVTLGSFWMDRTEVSNGQYARCVQDGACRVSRLASDPTYNGDDYPVAGIPWQDAMDYCTWAGGRLPTEAEWEYAARGAEGRIYPWGDAFDCAGGNFGDDLTGCDDGHARTAPVASFPDGASWCGALDMAGNVWEWVSDKFGDYPAEAQTNPTGLADGELNLLRGGSWGYGRNGVRAAYRYPVPPSADYLGVGFRCVVGATPVGEALPPLTGSGGGVIAFTSERDGEGDIYVMNADGSDQRRLTDDPAYDAWPTWSPDGSKIAFVSTRSGNADIYVMDADGTNVRQLTYDPASDIWPEWSPDGSRIAFPSRRDGNFEIYVIGANGANLQRLTNTPSHEDFPAWSSDSTQIVFSRIEGDDGAYVMTVPGRTETAGVEQDSRDERKLLGFAILEPAWSPDGARIAFGSDHEGFRGIYVMNVGGVEQGSLDLQRLSDTRAGENCPAWSPDGARIAFASWRDGDGEIYVMDADGNNLQQLTDNRSADEFPTWRPICTPNRRSSSSLLGVQYGWPSFAVSP
jgi:formylglycine-generating enzyme required for sulfatase activity